MNYRFGTSDPVLPPQPSSQLWFHENTATETLFFWSTGADEWRVIPFESGVLINAKQAYLYLSGASQPPSLPVELQTGIFWIYHQTAEDILWFWDEGAAKWKVAGNFYISGSGSPSSAPVLTNEWWVYENTDDTSIWWWSPDILGWSQLTSSGGGPTPPEPPPESFSFPMSFTVTSDYSTGTAPFFPEGAALALNDMELSIGTWIRAYRETLVASGPVSVAVIMDFHMIPPNSNRIMSLVASVDSLGDDVVYWAEATRVSNDNPIAPPTLHLPAPAIGDVMKLISIQYHHKEL